MATTSAFAQTGQQIDLDTLNIDGTLPKKSYIDKLEVRRHKLEQMTMQRILKRIEINRIKQELILSHETEEAFKKLEKNMEIK